MTAQYCSVSHRHSNSHRELTNLPSWHHSSLSFAGTPTSAPSIEEWILRSFSSRWTWESSGLNIAVPEALRCLLPKWRGFSKMPFPSPRYTKRRRDVANARRDDTSAPDKKSYQITSRKPVSRLPATQGGSMHDLRCTVGMRKLPDTSQTRKQPKGKMYRKAKEKQAILNSKLVQPENTSSPEARKKEQTGLSRDSKPATPTIPAPAHPFPRAGTRCRNFRSPGSMVSGSYETTELDDRGGRQPSTGGDRHKKGAEN